VGGVKFQTGLELSKSSYTTEDDSYTTEKPKRVEFVHPVRTPRGSKDKNPLDDLDQKILKLLPNGYYCRSLARVLKRSTSTIQYRLEKLQKLGIITPEKHNIANNSTVTYSIAPSWVAELFSLGVRNAPQTAPFSAHAMLWRFPILSGVQPKSAFPQRMNNSTFYRFYEDSATIISTPKSLLIYVKVDLGADTIDNLNAKYLEIARSVAHQYAKRFDLALGTPDKPSKTHYAIKGARISELVRDRGTFETTGFTIDDSHGEAHIETRDEELAKGFEFTLTEMPKVVGSMARQIANVQEMIKGGVTQQQAINNMAYIAGNLQCQINEIKKMLEGSNPRAKKEDRQ